MKNRLNPKALFDTRLLRPFTALVLAFVLLTLSLVAIAWFSYVRRMGAVAEITDPTAIFINAGNAEDVRYLDLGGIDVEGENSYKDFVFCIRGNHVSNYKIQLSYTTNNQFDYEIYTATMVTSPGAVPANPESLVVYDTHDGSSGTQYYYAASGATPLPGSFLNKDTGASEKLAKNNDSYYEDTYTPGGTNSTYDNRHKYAIPLYWHTSSSISPVMDANSDFCDYFILRVIWDSNSRNNKETDIVYIAAKNISA
ncbi:MAG: hypothetical protein J5659_00045 [Clostridia bacterium]|nr:hypothetical protein [Clostridia bacterium]